MSLPLQVLQSFRNERAQASFATLSRDGRLAAVSLGTYIHVYEAKTGRRLQTFSGHASEIRGLDFNWDGTRLVSGSADQTIRVWDVRTGRLQSTLRGHESAVYWVAFARDGQTVASGDRTVARIWDLKRGKVLYTLPVGDDIYAGEFSPDNRWLATASSGYVSLWDVVTGKRSRSLPNGKEGMFLPVDGLAFSPDSRLLAYTNGEGKLVLHDVQSARSVRTIPTSGWDVSFSKDGREVYSGTTVFNVATGARVRTVTLPSTESLFQFDAARTTVLSLSEGGVPKLWSWPQGKVISKFAGFSSDVFQTGFDQTGALLFTAGAGYRYGQLSADAVATVWNVKTGKALYQSSDAAEVAALSPNGKLLAYAGWAGKKNVQLVNLSNKVVFRTFPVEGRVNTLAFSPTGKRLAISTYDTIQVYDTATWKVVFEKDNDNSDGLQFSPDGTTLFIKNFDVGIEQWNLATQKRERLIGAPDRDNDESLYTFALSPDGRWMAVNSTDRIRVYSLENVKQQFETLADGGGADAVAFSPDSKVLAVGESDTVEFVSVPGGKMLSKIQGLAGPSVNSLAFNPDGTTLAVAAGTQTTLASLTLWGVSGKTAVFAPGIAGLRKLETAFQGGQISPTQLIRAKALLNQPEIDPVLQAFLSGQISVAEFARQF